MIQCLNFGGMENSAIKTATYLIEEGHEVEFISLHKPQKKVKEKLDSLKKLGFHM